MSHLNVKRQIRMKLRRGTNDNRTIAKAISN